MKPLPRLIVLCCAPGFLALAGCSGKSGSSVNPDDVKYLGVALIGYSEFKDKAPTSIDDILAFKATADLPKKTVEQVRSGDIVAVWNVNFNKYKKTKDEINEYVIAYEKDAPTKGGYVMMGLENPKKVTAEEFKKLKIAK